MTSAIHARLRAATRAHHQALEDRVDVLGRAASAHGRRELVQGFHQLHAEAETAIAPWVADLAGLQFEARRRTAQLKQDLTALGLTSSTVDHRPPAVRSAVEALGRMYVLEGSTLGGRLLTRGLTAAGHDLVGLGFLDPYGDGVGERWRSFLAILE